VAYHVADASKLEWEERPPVVEGQPSRNSANVSKPGTPLQVRNEGDEELVLYIYGAPQKREGADFFDDPGDL